MIKKGEINLFLPSNFSYEALLWSHSVKKVNNGPDNYNNSY